MEEKKCTKPGCGGKHYGLGLCGRCYRRTRKFLYPLYVKWAGMIQRCTNPKMQNYQWYGGRGIKVCSSWRASYAEFERDLLPSWKPGLELDRINNDGDYEPGNVRWSDRVEQANNSRTAVRLTAFGRTQAVGMWARELGVPRDTIHARLELRWTPERAVSEPVQVCPTLTNSLKTHCKYGHPFPGANLYVSHAPSRTAKGSRACVTCVRRHGREYGRRRRQRDKEAAAPAATS